MDPILPEAVPSSVPSQESSNLIPGPSSNPEKAPNTAPERAKETQPSQAASGLPVPSPQLLQPASGTPAAVPPTSAGGASDDPIIADDVDVIEKEWVDKAKKIVNATKEDPYQQEKEVSKLQADYLMKRYNKQVKLSE